MKSALYIEDGLVQLVLTPQTAAERSILKHLENEEIRCAHVIQGSFGGCRGGYIRMFEGGPHDNNRSLIIKMGPKPDDALTSKETL